MIEGFSFFICFADDNYKYLDKIVLPVLDVIKNDSIKRAKQAVNNIAYDGFKTVTVTASSNKNHCLEFYASPKLDSIANVQIAKMKILWIDKDPD